MNQQSPDEPDWSLLPHDPCAFFGVPHDVDARTLKRSYNRLIRKYKPERFPEEFQKIRAAYEDLSSDVRYGQQRRARPGSQFDWGESSDQSSPNSEPASRGQSEPKSDSGADSYGEEKDQEGPFSDQLDCFDFDELDRQKAIEEKQSSRVDPGIVERLSSESVDSVFAELREKIGKSPRDYFHLCMFSVDSSAESGDPSFEFWLLEGLAEYPEEAGLLNLFRSYLKRVEAARLPGLLLTSVTKISNNKYLYATEAAWDRMLREQPFELFRETLDQCETHLDTTSDQSILIFYLHILRPAIIKADDDWLDKVRGEIEDSYYDLPEWAQHEYEYLSYLIQYRDIRAQVISRGRVSKKIDEVIQQWCLDRSEAVDQAVVDCQYEVAASGQELLEEYPDPNEDLVQFTMPWSFIVEDVTNRISPILNFDHDEATVHAQNFMMRANRRGHRGGRYASGIVLTLFAIGATLTCWILAVAFIVRFFYQGYLGAWGWGLLNLLWAALLAGGGLLCGIKLLRWGQKLARIHYKWVRAELLKLLRVVPLKSPDLAQLILSTNGQKFNGKDEITDADEVAEDMADDAAIEIYSIAQRLLHSDALSYDELELLD